MHKGLCCVSSQKCTNRWEQVKNGVNELKTVRKSLNMNNIHLLYFETLKVPIIGAEYARRPSGALYRVCSQPTDR